MSMMIMMMIIIIVLIMIMIKMEIITSSLELGRPGPKESDSPGESAQRAEVIIIIISSYHIITIIMIKLTMMIIITIIFITITMMITALYPYTAKRRDLLRCTDINTDTKY